MRKNNSVGKILASFLEIMFFAAMLVIIICAVSYQKNGIGIGYENHGDYKTLIVSRKSNVTTYIIGDFPESDSLGSIEHREGSSYYSLTDNEKVVYDYVLDLAEKISREETRNTEIHISLENMSFPGIEDSLSYSDLKNIVCTELEAIDYEKIYKALHLDYEYMMWWEYNMEWEISEPDIVSDKCDIAGSNYVVTVVPVSEYAEDRNTVSESAVETFVSAYNRAAEYAESASGMSSMEKLEFFKDVIFANTEYDSIAGEKVFYNADEPYIMKTRNFINVFDGDSSTNSICGGYSNAFQLLCDLSDFEGSCMKANGTATTASGSQKHTWNIVLLDGQYYLADLVNSQEETVGHTGSLFMTPIYNTENYSINYTNWDVIQYSVEAE